LQQLSEPEPFVMVHDGGVHRLLAVAAAAAAAAVYLAVVRVETV